jgi:hypothetical protein
LAINNNNNNFLSISQQAVSADITKNLAVGIIIVPLVSLCSTCQREKV